ncbi:unnamed protein product [Peniophora sp. CBMAI 1063]|nr:unnamed protein product [Peniophora sp. CBMAI 1063]
MHLHPSDKCIVPFPISNTSLAISHQPPQNIHAVQYITASRHTWINACSGAPFDQSVGTRGYELMLGGGRNIARSPRRFSSS